MPSQPQSLPDAHRNHDRLQQDVASLNATVRKVEAEQLQLAGAINALANKFDALSDRIAQLGKPNYQAAGFIAAVLMAFGGLVWNFSWEQIKLNRASIERIIDQRNTKAVEDAGFVGNLNSRLRTFQDAFEPWRQQIQVNTRLLGEMENEAKWQNAAIEDLGNRLYVIESRSKGD